MKAFQSIFSNILKEIKPTEKEIALVRSIVEELRILLSKRANELNINYTTIEAQGSTGIKQTHLRNDFDIDIFIGLNFEKYKSKYESLSKTKFKKEIKKEFLKFCHDWIIESLSGSKFSKPKLLYAEHPYIQVKYFEDNYPIEIDLVLYYDLSLEFIRKNGPITAVDRSPWHGKFIEKNLNEKQKDDVRLLKQFFKANHSYGDKSPVGRVGFIGYCAELLIYHFENIINVLTNFSTLKDAPLDYFGRSEEDLRAIDHFEKDYLIITDPIDKNRNVASAISEKAYIYCTHRISEFLTAPNESYFILEEIPEFDAAVSEEINENLFVVELRDKASKIHYTENRDKLYSLGEYIKVHGEKEFTHESRFGKIVFEVYFEQKIKEYNLVFFCEKPKISKFYTRRGPPLKAKKHLKKFKRKNPDYFIEDNYLWTKEERECYEFESFLRSLVEERKPNNLHIINIGNSTKVKSSSGKKALYVLKNMILPFSESNILKS